MGNPSKVTILPPKFLFFINPPWVIILCAFPEQMVVLLIIFMIITPIMVLNSIQLQLPQSASEKQPPTKNIIIAVKPDGSVYLNNELVTPGLLTDKVTLLMQLKPDSAVIYSDKKVDVETIVDVIDQIEAGGMHTISLTTERKTQGQAPLPTF